MCRWPNCWYPSRFWSPSAGNTPYPWLACNWFVVSPGAMVHGHATVFIVSLPPVVVFRRHISSEFIGRAVNKDDALSLVPSVCTTVVAIATDFMQVMHVHKWTSVGTCNLQRQLSSHCKCCVPWTPCVQPVKSETEVDTGSHEVRVCGRVFSLVSLTGPTSPLLPPVVVPRGLSMWFWRSSQQHCL